MFRWNILSLPTWCVVSATQHVPCWHAAPDKHPKHVMLDDGADGDEDASSTHDSNGDGKSVAAERKQAMGLSADANFDTALDNDLHENDVKDEAEEEMIAEGKNTEAEECTKAIEWTECVMKLLEKGRRV